MFALVMLHFLVPHVEHPDYTTLFAGVSALMLAAMVLLGLLAMGRVHHGDHLPEQPGSIFEYLDN